MRAAQVEGYVIKSDDRKSNQMSQLGNTLLQNDFIKQPNQAQQQTPSKKISSNVVSNSTDDCCTKPQEIVS